MPPPSASPAFRLRLWQAAVMILGLALACYWPALHGGLVWDDQAHVTKPELRSLAGLVRIWFELGATQQYYPVLHSAFWIEHKIWGDATLGYHLVNVLLHATAAFLFALVLRRLANPAWAGPAAVAAPNSPSSLRSSEAGRPGLPAGTPWLAALIFVTLPVCVESVAWISEQKNTLSLVFYLLAVLAYLRFDRSRNLDFRVDCRLDFRPPPGAENQPRRSSRSASEDGRSSGLASKDGRKSPTQFYALATALFVLALLTKTVTATLPAALLVVFWWQRGRLSWRRDVVPLIPWFAVALVSGLFTAWVERTLIGAEGSDFDLTLVQRCLLAGRVIWFYLGKLFWPSQLVFIYPHWNVKSSASAWAGYLLGALAVTVALWLLRRRWRGPLAAWLFFVGSLFPALGFFNVYPFIFSYVADHFQYLASLGIVTAVSAGAAWLLARASPGLRTAGGALGAVVIATLGFLSHAQSRTYGDLPTLYATTIERNPDCWMAHYNLGILLAVDGHLDQAIGHFQTAIQIKPDYTEAMVNWGDVLLQKGDIPAAVHKYEEALRINPNGVEAHNNLGLILAKTALSTEAIAHYEEALRLNPNFAPAHFNLANILRSQGKIPEAISHYESALRLNPDYAEASVNLGGVLLQGGRLPEAIRHFESALRVKPDYADAHNNLGLALARSGRLQEAIAHYQEALRIKPDYAAAHANFGYVLRQIGRTDEANAQFARAAELNGPH